jgi:uncharacterized protein YoxC
MLIMWVLSASPLLSQTTKQESSRKDSSTQNQVDVSVNDLPQPIPNVLDTLQRIGNEVGEEISKATSKAAEVVNKVVRDGKPSDNK